jgi:hypothetical protein
MSSQNENSRKAKPTRKKIIFMKNRNIQFHPTAGLLIPLLLAAFALMFLEYDTRAQSTADLPEPTEPWLAEPGDWAAEFNEAQIACYKGSTAACDSIRFHDRRIKMFRFLASQQSRLEWGCVSAIDSKGRTIWIVDAHRDDGNRFIIRAMKS